MYIAEVIGSVVASHKTENMNGLSLRIVRKLTTDLEPSETYAVAVDVIGASEGELVLVATGSTARQTQLIPLWIDRLRAGAVRSAVLPGNYLDRGAPAQCSLQIQILVAHQSAPVPSLRTLCPDVPDLEAVVLRFLDATSLAQALQQCRCADQWTQAEAALWWRAQTVRDGTQPPMQPTVEVS